MSRAEQSPCPDESTGGPSIPHRATMQYQWWRSHFAISVRQFFYRQNDKTSRARAVIVRRRNGVSSAHDRERPFDRPNHELIRYTEQSNQILLLHCSQCSRSGGPCYKGRRWPEPCQQLILSQRQPVPRKRGMISSKDLRERCRLAQKVNELCGSAGNKGSKTRL